MTIDGFWKEVNEKINLEDYRVSFPTYVHNHYNSRRKFLTVGIDIYQWIFEHSSFADSNSAVNFPEKEIPISVVVSGIASKLRYLISLPLNFVIVFDGLIKLGKERWDVGRGVSADDIYEEKYLKDLQTIKNNGHIIRHKCVLALIELLNAWNISYIHAPGDAEIELARLNSAGIIDAIISNDADGFAYGAKVILRNFSKFINDKPNTGLKGDSKREQDYYVTPVTLGLLNELNLDTDKILFIACCQGDDYSKGMKGLGIKKAWALATNTSTDFDVVNSLKDIYVSRDAIQHLKGKVPYSYNERLKMLEQYKARLMQHILDNSRAYFGRVHSSDITLPSDYIISSHYYPHFATYLFRFEPFESNFNECDGRLNENYHLPKLPQPLSIKKSNGNYCEIFRGNDLNGFQGFTRFNNQSTTDTEPIPILLTPMQWFTKPDYKILSKLTKTSRARKDDMEFLAESLGLCYIWRAIVIMHYLNLKSDDIFIKTQKSIMVKCNGREFEQIFYQVKFKPRQIFKSFLNLPHEIYDENLKKVEEKHIHVWLPSYLFYIEENGRSLVEIYNNGKSKKASTPKSTPINTPRKKKTPTQKTTLDVLSLSSKSPIKILSRQSSTLLELSGATRVNVNSKRDATELEDPNINNSPNKKAKPVEPSTINPNLIEPFEEDAEVSRVLENSDYVGNSYIDTNESDHENMEILGDLETFTEFLQNSKNNNGLSDEIKEIESNNNNSFFEPKKGNRITMAGNEVFPLKKDFIKDSLSVSRGGSLMDNLTRLPSVPKGSSEAFRDGNALKEENYELLNDSFSSTDSMEQLFAMDNSNKVEIKKQPENKFFESDVTKAETSGNLISSNGSSNNMADTSCNDKKEVEINEVNENSNSGEREHVEKNPYDEDRDNTTIESVQSALDLTQGTEEDRRERDVLPNNIKSDYEEIDSNIALRGQIDVDVYDVNLSNDKKDKAHEESYSLPSDFEGDEILLAENTDDEIMWIIPDDLKHRKHSDIIEL